MVLVSLEKTENGRWEDVKSIKTWKRLDDQNLTGIDGQVLWSKSFGSKISLDSGILGELFFLILNLCYRLIDEIYITYLS